MKYDIPAGARHILHTLRDAGYEAYLVGGCVRDLLRGVEPGDWDICTSALPDQTEACFSARKTIETGLKHGTVTVLDAGGAYEVTTYRTDGAYTDGRRPDSVRFVSDLREDLSRRDFTVNAMAMDLSGAVADPFGGAHDLCAGIIRCVGDPDRRFQEDGLRLMRALRFSAVLGYSIEPGTAQAIHRNLPMLDHVAAERINVELCKLLVGVGAGRVLREYPDVFCRFWPELKPLVDLEQNTPWHCWGGWEHTIRALEAIRPTPVLRLTMLLHDVGKPACKTVDENGVDHFYGHPAVSRELCEKMLRELKFDNDTRHQVLTLVQHHDVQLEPRENVIRRWLNKLGAETFFALLEVQRADGMGQDPEKAACRFPPLDELKAMAENIIAQQQCFSLKDLAVDGRDVMAAGVPAGPQVGRVLGSLLDKVLAGDLPNDRETLLSQIAAQQ